MMHRIAFMAASTGPFPEAAASNFSPAMSNPMLATDFIPTPAVTCRKSSCMRALAVLSFPTNINISSSLISFLRSASLRNES